MTDKKQKETPEDKALKQLKTGKPADQLKALEKLRQHGSEKSIFPLVDTLLNSRDETLKEGIISFLNDLRNPSALQPLIEAIQDETYGKVRSHLLQAVWQSNLDASDYLYDLVSVADYGTYEDCIEVMTILDNLEGPFSSSDVEESIGLLSVAIHEADEERAKLLLAINEIVGTLPVEL